MSSYTIAAPARTRPAPSKETRETGQSSVRRVRRFLRSPKGTLTLLFLPLLLVAGTARGWPMVLPHILSAIAGTCLADVLVTRVRKGTWTYPTGALLSGMIVAFILAPETAGAITLLIGGLASLSKHTLRMRRVHVFNPAAVALLVSIPLFSTGQSWWGALPDLPWPWFLLLLASGAIVVDRINKFPLVLTFTGAYFLLFTLAAQSDAARAAEMFRPPFLQASLFLALFMLTDPPTSPSTFSDQIWIGLLVAVASFLAQWLGAGQAYLLIGLLAGNVVLACQRWTAQTAAESGMMGTANAD